jgi:hypothetical protein
MTDKTPVAAWLAREGVTFHWSYDGPMLPADGSEPVHHLYRVRMFRETAPGSGVASLPDLFMADYFAVRAEHETLARCEEDVQTHVVSYLLDAAQRVLDSGGHFRSWYRSRGLRDVESLPLDARQVWDRQWEREREHTDALARFLGGERRVREWIGATEIVPV